MSVNGVISIHSEAKNLAIGDARILSDGTPVRTFKRYVMQVGGVYKKKSWREPLNATDVRCSHWESQANKMLSNGVPIKITEDHKDRKVAKNCMGDLLSLQREGNWIAATFDVRGADNIKTAEANKDMSVEIEPRISDGAGNEYTDAIAAITFTPIPVVHSQPIAASMADEPYLLSQETAVDNGKLYSSIAKLAGVAPETVTDDTALSMLDSHAAKCTMLNTAKFSLESEVAALKADKAGLEGKILKLSQDNEPDTRYLSLAARTAESLWDNAVRMGAVDVNTSTVAKAFLIGTKTGDNREFSKLALSLSCDADEAVIDLNEKIIKFMTDNKPVKTGAAVGVQRLNREVPDADAQTAPKTIKSAWTGKDVSVEPAIAN